MLLVNCINTTTVYKSHVFNNYALRAYANCTHKVTSYCLCYTHRKNTRFNIYNSITSTHSTTTICITQWISINIQFPGCVVYIYASVDKGIWLVLSERHLSLPVNCFIFNHILINILNTQLMYNLTYLFGEYKCRIGPPENRNFPAGMSLSILYTDVTKIF